MSIQSSWDNYSNSCVCGYAYENNCAHYLSNALTKGGFSEINGGVGGNFRIVNGFCVCRSGCPVRAKELRDWFGRKWSLHSSPPSDGTILVYQESRGQGHVLLKKYKDGKSIDYKGTTDLPSWPIQQYYYWIRAASTLTAATKKRKKQKDKKEKNTD